MTGTCSKMFPAGVQFGHAGAKAGSDLETADAKTAAARELCAVADHLARKHIIHKNKAARLKSRAQKAMNKKAA